MKLSKIKPSELISYRRIDLIPKIIYAKSREKNIKSKWPKELYEQHIRVFNGGYELYPVKKNLQEFLKSFHKLLDSLKKGSFDNSDPVIVSKDNILLDGAHRVSAGFAYNKEIAYKKQNKTGPIYDFSFFKNKIRYVPEGLEEKYLDYIALEYCKLKNNTYIAIIFPSVKGGENEIKNILKKRTNIVYEKKIFLKNQGPLNLIKQVYSDQEWLGNWKNNFRGAKRKMMNCFINSEPLKVFLIESKNLENIIKTKEEIRKIFKIGNHSIHINDHQEETIKLAQIFFNNNSIHFINNSNQKYFKNFHNLLAKYENWIKENNFPPENFCIDGSSVLALYGIRDSEDLDFLSKSSINSKIKKIENHNSNNSHEKEIDDLLFNPENHFYFNGLKFLSLENIKNMKLKRNELKDKMDLKMIEDLLKNKHSSAKKRRNLKSRIIRTKIFQKINYLLNRLHTLFNPLLSKLGI